MEVNKLKKIIKLKQKLWLKNFFENNTEVGAKATAEVGENLPKIVSFSLFGKQIEIVRTRREWKL